MHHPPGGPAPWPPPAAACARSAPAKTRLDRARSVHINGTKGGKSGQHGMFGMVGSAAQCCRGLALPSTSAGQQPDNTLQAPAGTCLHRSRAQLRACATAARWLQGPTTVPRQHRIVTATCNMQDVRRGWPAGQSSAPAACAAIQVHANTLRHVRLLGPMCMLLSG